MPFSHYSGLWQNIPRCLPQIQMGLAGRLRVNSDDDGNDAYLNVTK